MEFVEQLKSSVDIVKVIGEYVRLRKTGAVRYSGLCPFHNEKTPSFSVHAGHQFYICFGCGAKGDLLKFVMEIQGISFYEALKLLAEQHGIAMPKRSEYSDPDTRQRAILFQAHETAAEAFRKNLAGSAGEEARAYLEKRGVTREIADQFGLGYADRSGRSMVRLLENQKLTPEQMERTGLVVKRQDGTFYDAFRNRLMFPIHNESGKVIAFGGRALDPSEKAKYVNSPETAIYKKSSVLYNLHRAKESVRKNDRAVLVEGYMDVIGVYASGVREVVASCGTALTPQQVRALKRHSARIAVNFDPDAAGAGASERSINLLLDEGMQVRIVELDGGLDPDEYCKERGADAYRARLDGAKSYFYWLADRARAGSDMRSPEGRIATLQFLLPAVQRVSDRVERMAVAHGVASYLGVEAGVVVENFLRAAGERREKMQPPPAEPLPAVEKILLNLLVSSAEARKRLIPTIREVAAIAELPSGRIFQAIFALHDAGSSITFSDIHERLEEGERRLLVTAVLADETEEASVSLEQGEACLATLQRSAQRRDLAALKARVKNAERAGDLAEALRLAGELQRIERN